MASATTTFRPILFADDSPEMRRAWRRPLEKIRSPSEMTASVEETIAVLERVEPCVVLSDVVFPDGLGFAILDRARKLHPRAPRLLFSGERNALTGILELDWNTRAQQLTGHWLLVKPFDIVTIQHFVLEAIAEEAGNEGRVPSLLAQIASLAKLTPKGFRLLNSVAAGKTTHKMLCEELHVAPNTLDNRVRDLRQRMGFTFDTLKDLQVKVLLAAFGLQGGLDLEQIRHSDRPAL